MKYTLRDATVDDGPAMRALLPRLAAFDVPKIRNPDHLWLGDREMLNDWLENKNPNVLVEVGVDQDNQVLGLTIVSMREELLSHEPSAHLEVLAISADAEGIGLGRALLDSAQQKAKQQGAQSMSLHVFANNSRARALYERAGFDGELLRYYKPL